MPVEYTKSYERHRIREPKEFQKGSLRTFDVGRKGYSKIVIGRLKGKTSTAMQSMLIGQEEPKSTKKMLRKQAATLSKRAKGWHGERKRHAIAARKRRR